MEQHNLVVSPDGKTWDELTRDTSYIGNLRCNFLHDDDTAWETVSIFTNWRGGAGSRDLGNKDFAISYDRLICLVDGHYELYARTYSTGTNNNQGWKVNGSLTTISYTNTTSTTIVSKSIVYLMRGDYVQLFGEFGTDSDNYNDCTITRI